MFCPSCGSENISDNDLRFCRSCGADLRAVSKVMNRSLPVRLASALDSYLENRYQQNLRNGVLNLVAFLFLLIVGTGYLISGWTGFGSVMLVLSLISIITGIWDIWIYKRNLPPIAEQSKLRERDTSQIPRRILPDTPNSVTEQTTRHLSEIGQKDDQPFQRDSMF